MSATDHRTATLRCSDALLCRHGDKLTISWHDGGALTAPVSWCRDIRADRTDEGGVQIVLRLVPVRGNPGTSLMVVRLHTEPDDSLPAREFAEILSRELGLPGELPPAEPRLRLVPRADPGWVVSLPGAATEAFYEDVLRRSAGTREG
ncbi:hypothetical protein [Streptomyces malaysiense]|uniref:Uncharacterized protein n=1 Tax=Streptomyces malaysiense TaxID=1428626 RepID=A0A1J4PVD2_9ACTN|nr:hypothetical protein [Streptomyces malaysiense]OIK24721.1 hypothetical protein VT52_025400 [Streptomyces malaysiense]